MFIRQTMKFSGNYLYLSGLLALVMAFTACDTDDPEARAAKDRKKILDYIEEHNLDAYEVEGGVFIVIEVEGSGSHPHEGSTVRMNYQGYLLDDTLFDSANNANIYLPNTVRGFRIGVMEFRRGGKGMILIPSGMGYGETVTASIPRNAVLIFHVEIIDFY